jgi:hypothetical protein
MKLPEKSIEQKEIRQESADKSRYPPIRGTRCPRAVAKKAQLLFT